MKKSVISVFDLNIRYFNDIDGINIWDFRKERLVQCILNYCPDILMFQEITKIQYDYIEDNLGSVYDFVGFYRDSTEKSEKCSLCYNANKYTLNDWGQFWLSSTPNVPGSNDFRNNFPRICTWASLKQLNGVDLLYFNIHLDHVNFDAHLPCMNVVLEQSEKIIAKLPQTKCIFLGGCFYCEEDDPVIFKLKEAGYTVFGGVNAPYIWLKTPEGVSSWQFFDLLLDRASVVGTPGCGFGPSGEGYFRLTAFGSFENTVEAMERIKNDYCK